MLWSSLLGNGIAVYELWFFQLTFQMNCQEKMRWICPDSSSRHKIISCLSHSSFSLWKWMNFKAKKIQESNSMPFLVFPRDHLRSNSGIICGLGSFAVQFGDHLRSRIICSAVQISPRTIFQSFAHPFLCHSHSRCLAIYIMLLYTLEFDDVHFWVVPLL